MNITIELARTILTIVLTVLSLSTSIVAMKYKKSKKEMLSFVYDLLIMLAGGLFTLGTFAVIYQLLIVKVKTYLGLYELAKISDDLRTYKKRFIALTWLSILGEFVSLVSEMIKHLP